MSEILIDLMISSQDYLALYQGIAKDVITKDRRGKTVRFPAKILRPFVTHHGISGTFRIEFDVNNKFKKITRLVG